jgi:hypothetical protein
MKRTRKAKYIVKQPTNSSVFSTTKTHLWFQVLEGPDQGKRLRIPLYNKEYSEELAKELTSLENGDVIEAVLERKDTTGVWTPIELKSI